MRVLLCNCPAEQAPELARALVTERLAACVNVLPGVRSFYLWDGALQDDAEVTLLVKVSDATVDRAVARLQALHSYDVPEVLVLPVEAERSAPAYVAWVDEVTR